MSEDPLTLLLKNKAGNYILQNGLVEVRKADYPP